MNWIVYETTNEINGHYYIGVHRQKENPWNEDGYYGSGIIISNVKDEILSRGTLFVFHNEESAYSKEGEIVTQEYVDCKHCYNMCLGGKIPPKTKKGSKRPPRSEEWCRKISESKKGNIPWNKGKKTGQIPWNKGKPQTKDVKRKQSESMKGKPAWNKGIPLSEKAKLNLSRIQTEKYNKSKLKEMNDKDWYCPICHKRFTTKGGLGGHTKRIHKIDLKVLMLAEELSAIALG